MISGVGLIANDVVAVAGDIQSTARNGVTAAQALREQMGQTAIDIGGLSRSVTESSKATEEIATNIGAVASTATATAASAELAAAAGASLTLMARDLESLSARLRL